METLTGGAPLAWCRDKRFVCEVYAGVGGHISARSGGIACLERAVYFGIKPIPPLTETGFERQWCVPVREPCRSSRKSMSACVALVSSRPTRCVRN